MVTANDRQEHIKNLIPETRKMLDAGNEERILYIETDKFINYGVAKQVLSKLEDLIKIPRRLRMPCLLIYGESNIGKSSLVNKFGRLHPYTDGIDGPAGPVVIAQAPKGPDVSSMFDKILTKVLVPFKHTDSDSKKENEIHYHFAKMETKMLIIDEFHNILSGSGPKQRAFMNALKNLSNELYIPIVLVGTKDALNATNTDLQIMSRFRPMLLPRWELNEDYISLLGSLERLLPLREPSGLARSVDMAKLILELSEGILGDIVAIVNETAIRAIRTDKERITLELIKEGDFIKPSLLRGHVALQSA